MVGVFYFFFQPMPRIEWNAPCLYYMLWYGRVSDKVMKGVNITDPTQGKFSVENPGYYELWQFKIQAVNDEGPGKESPLVTAYSGQDPPDGKPEDFTVVSMTARSVELSWTPVTVTRGNVAGYRVRLDKSHIYLLKLSYCRIPFIRPPIGHKNFAIFTG